MKNSLLIASHEIRSQIREKTFLLLLAVFVGMTLASTFIGWSSQDTISRVYSVVAQEKRQSGQSVPPSPFENLPPLSLAKNMIIYVVLIGGLLAIDVGYSTGMRERKAGAGKLLFSRPITRADFLIGKLLGVSFILAAVLSIAAVISMVSSAVLVRLEPQDILRLSGFYGFSFVYMLGFAFLGFGFAMAWEDEVMALLSPLIVWVVITFMLPELSSALYPTGSLNPTLPQTDILQSPALQAIHDIVYPFSISEHYKGCAAAILGIDAGTDATIRCYGGATIFAWLLFGILAGAYAMSGFDASRW